MVTHNRISRGGACGSQYGWLVALGVATLLYTCCLQVTAQGNTTNTTTPTNTPITNTTTPINTTITNTTITNTNETSNANTTTGAVCQTDTCGQGTCNVTNGTAVCTCAFGWKGDNCSQGIPCQNDTCVHGSCTNTSGAAVCTCERGWTGSNCSQGILCQNDTCVHGSCNVTSGTAVCTCQQGWTGYNCSQGTPCLNNTCAHGTCNETSGTAVCTCAVGWIGYKCSQGIRCRNDTCVHGTCNDTNGPAACTCDQGWTGTNCSEDVDECGREVCQHGGLCENRLGSYYCVCHSGWTGRNCHEDVDECNATKCSQPNEGCNNTNGSYTCQCNAGYERLKPASPCQETVLVPYATNTTQRQWGDDVISGPFPIPYGFMHGSTVIMQYYFSTNGYLTFSSPFSQPTMPDLASPRLRPLSFLAPYWADVDIPQANTTSGLYHVAISLEQTSGNAELKELFDRYSQLPVLKDFMPVFIAVVTWKDVLPYKAEDFPKLDPATVQVLVATDGRRVRVRAAWRSVWSRLAEINVSALMHWAGDDTPLTWPLTDIPARQNFTSPASPTTKPVKPCVQWLSTYGQQLRDTGNDGVACPCSVEQAKADPLFRVNLTQSPVCAVSHVFHPRTGRKKTCCYGPPVSHPMLSTEVWYPSIPELKDAGNSSQVRRGFEQCCSRTAGTFHPMACTHFRQLFPVDQCDAYRAPLAALVWGSGHIITTDKVQYTVNPWGEFLLLRFNDTTANRSSTPLEVQGRWQETTDAGDNLTALTGIALKYGDQPPMSIYPINQQLKFYVNGQEKTQADNGPSSDIALMITGNDTLDMVFPSGVTVKAKVSGSHMSLTFTAMTLGNLSEVKGLLVARSVSSNLTTSNPLQRLTQAKIWSLTQNESLFAYNVGGRGDNFTSTQRPDFQPANLPSTAAELLAALNRTNQTGGAMCGGSVVCLHDLLATGNATTAQRTKTAEEDFWRMVQTLGQRPPVFNVTTQVLNVSVSAGVSPLRVSVSPEVTNSSLYPNVTLTVEGQPDTVTLNYTFVKAVNPAGWMLQLYPDNKVRNLTFLTLTVTATSAVTGMTSVYRPTVVMCGCEQLAQCDYSGIDQMVAGVSRRIAVWYYVAQCRCNATKGGRFCQDDVSVCDVCYDASLCNSNPTDNTTCQCPQGYVGNGLKCYERDECQRGDRCEHRCNNTRGSFVCSCNTGFSLVANGRCQDRDECVAKEDNCTSAQFCENTVGSFVCPCRPSFGGKNCQLRVKYRYGGELKFRSLPALGQGWTDDLRQPHSKAFMQMASKVIAIVGNSLKSQNVSFVDVTVLSFSPVNTARRRRSASATSAPSAIVTNFVVSMEQAEDAASLKVAFKAGFDPVCISGLCRYSAGKVVLYEVDKATSGFKADYDLCVSDRTNVCHNTSTLCTTTNGTTTCRCRQGYRPWTLYDNICQDKDECAENRSLCGVSATNSSLCRNTDGSYFCVCPPSFVWDGAAMQCAAVTLKDVCSEQKPCLHGAECVNTMDSASYACRCTDGWTGPTCADEDGEASRYKWTMIGVAIGLGVLCLIFLIIIIVVCVMRTRRSKGDQEEEPFERRSPITIPRASLRSGENQDDVSYETNSPKYADFRRRGSDAAVHDATNGNNIQRFSNPAYMDDGDLISKRL